MNEVNKYWNKCPACGGPCKNASDWAREVLETEIDGVGEAYREYADDNGGTYWSKI